MRILPVALEQVRTELLQPLHLTERGFKLGVDIAPLPHARDGKEVLAASLLELSLKDLPELEEREKIRAFVGELRMAFVGGRRALERATAADERHKSEE